MKCCKSIILTVLLVVFAVSPAVVRGQDEGIAALKETSKAFASVAKKTMPAVVSITVEKDVSISGRGGQSHYEEFFEQFFGYRSRPRQPQEYTQTGLGSGFIVSSDGYILTNNHVVGDADRIKVALGDGRTLDAEIVGVDPDSDIAVIKIEGKDFPVIELGDSDALDIGEWVIAVGNPFGLAETVTVGVVSAKGRSGFGITDGGYEDFIQTDAAINPGNSGGPLLNLDGEAIGVNTFIFSKSGGYMGIGFAVPINMAKRAKDQLISSGKITHGYLGIRMGNVKEGVAEFFGLDNGGGVIVKEVMEDSPAEKAGLKKDDIVLKIDGKEVKDTQGLRNTIAFLEPGTRVTLVIFRDSKEKKVKVKIGSLEDSKIATKMSRTAEELGLKVKEITSETARQFGYDQGEGVIITDVESGSPAGRAGIQAGLAILSVNRKAVSTIAEFNEALIKTKETRKALLEVRNRRYSWYEVLVLE
ncbi:MAG TPA: DegQ family serine endoprotease [Phycisphaerales bacterium]|nr:DegQ family serine endoprotease [Phycisphaerales bacterium]